MGIDLAMQINIREQGEVTILDLAGEIRLDDERGDSLQDAVRSQIGRGRKVCCSILKTWTSSTAPESVRL